MMRVRGKRTRRARAVLRSNNLPCREVRIKKEFSRPQGTEKLGDTTLINAHMHSLILPLTPVLRL